MCVPWCRKPFPVYLIVDFGFLYLNRVGVSEESASIGPVLRGKNQWLGDDSFKLNSIKGY